MVKIKHHHLKKILVVVLAVLAVGLAGLLYKQKMGGSSPETPNINSDNQPQVSAAGPVWTPAPGSEEEYLFSIKMDSPDEEKMRHYQYAISISQEAEFLNLTDCNPEPLVWKVKNGSTVKLKNDGNTEVKITMDAQHTYSVAAKSTKSIKADFGMGEGLYGYGCNTSPGSRGMIFVAHE